MIPLGKPLEKFLEIGALLLLAIGCSLVLWPFLSALLWAGVLCYATWPIYLRCELALGGRRSLAALLLTVLVAVTLVTPFAFVVATMAESVNSLVAAATLVLKRGPPTPPHWIAGLPVIGESLTAYWERLAYNAPAFVNELKKPVGPAALS